MRSQHEIQNGEALDIQTRLITFLSLRRPQNRVFNNGELS